MATFFYEKPRYLSTKVRNQQTNTNVKRTVCTLF